MTNFGPLDPCRASWATLLSPDKQADGAVIAR